MIPCSEKLLRCHNDEAQTKLIKALYVTVNQSLFVNGAFQSRRIIKALQRYQKTDVYEKAYPIIRFN